MRQGKLARLGIWFRRREDGTGSLSKLGGRPTLWPDIEWPATRSGWHASPFLGADRFGDLAADTASSRRADASIQSLRPKVPCSPYKPSSKARTAWHGSKPIVWIA